ncbi:uncharacterized protein LOC109853937 [Pseudomyrmex gracilis]|uniref:uncharacterized protein LOC109853937 n=1 Tax=Pseudomyrmex gracilis TaxID=219809 RepID=UPI000995603C|nr:uncharacterized protein LOC109853937 [Pseudomyrmex gracilis]
MAMDCVDGNYLGEYSRFFADFVARVNPDDQLPVKVSAYDIEETELVGEIIRLTLQYLNQTYCPPSLQSYIVHLVIQAIKTTCKKQPEICGLRQQEKTYAPLKLMQAVTNEVNEICRRYLDNSRLALLPPPSPLTPQVAVGAIRNLRRKMEDRHVVIHDLHTVFNIQDDTVANYYAVFDGHGGQDAAAYCATHLHQYLVESVHYPTDPKQALRDAFLTTDAQFIEKSNIKKLNGGTTAVCALVINKKLYIAWVGDSMASLVSRGEVMNLVNPHRPTREDETERITNMGGAVVHCMGVLRVNGFLSISRAIGDVLYKPFISGEPEVRCVHLDGTEDFLIIACDGLWDYVDPRTAALRVYRQVKQNPHDLKYVHQALLQSAKRAGSQDNITVIVVFLTPPIEIASRHITCPPPNGLLNNMDPNNPSSEFDKPFFRSQQLINAGLNQQTDFDIGVDRVSYDENIAASNGKRRDSDNDYDFCEEMGPETDVDAGEVVHTTRDVLNLESATTDVSVKTPIEIVPITSEKYVLDRNDNTGVNEEESSNHDNANVYPADPIDNRELMDHHDDKPLVQSSDANNSGDDDESPRAASSLQAAKPLQHELIPEAENVADSEDSEDEEWNYYRIDRDKEESRKQTEEESREDVQSSSVQESPDSARASVEVQDSDPDIDNRCKVLEEDISLPELIDLNISDQSKTSGEAHEIGEEKTQDLENKEDMDFQLNPEAAEFVPLSPPLLGNRSLQDYPISGSPFKQTPAMDDIPVPSESEFEEEVCRRPREIDDKDEHADSQQNNLPGLDESEVSSTKAEADDESIARIMSTTQWQPTDIAQWDAKPHDLESDLLEGDIVSKNNPMTMSLTPGDFEVAFERGVDLNAIHDLNDSTESVEPSSTPPRSPELHSSEEQVCTPFSDNKDILCASSTPSTLPDLKDLRILTSDVEDEGERPAATAERLAAELGVSFISKEDNPDLKEQLNTETKSSVEETKAREESFNSDAHSSECEYKTAIYDTNNSVETVIENENLSTNKKSKTDDSEQMVSNESEMKNDLSEVEPEMKTVLSEVESEMKTVLSEVEPEMKTVLSEVEPETKNDLSEVEPETKNDLSKVEPEIKNDLSDEVDRVTSTEQVDLLVDNTSDSTEKSGKQTASKSCIFHEKHLPTTVSEQEPSARSDCLMIKTIELDNRIVNTMSDVELLSENKKNLEENEQEEDLDVRTFHKNETESNIRKNVDTIFGVPKNATIDTQALFQTNYNVSHNVEGLYLNKETEISDESNWADFYNDNKSHILSKNFTSYPPCSEFQTNDYIDHSYDLCDKDTEDEDSNQKVGKSEEVLPESQKDIEEKTETQSEEKEKTVVEPPAVTSTSKILECDSVEKQVSPTLAEESSSELRQNDASEKSEVIVKETIAENHSLSPTEETVNLPSEGTTSLEEKDVIIEKKVWKSGRRWEGDQIAKIDVVPIVAPTKPKTTDAKHITKTTTTTAKTALTTATKSPTSPSKPTARTTATSITAQSAATKKSTASTAARPKQLVEGSAKATVSSISGKTTVTKATTTTKTTTTTATKSLRATVSTTKPRTSTTSKLNTSIEKKPTASGDAKSVGKTTAVKSPISAVKTATSSATATKTTSKSSTIPTTITSTISAKLSNTVSKSRPTSATAKPSPTTSKQSTVSGFAAAGASRPKTAPTTTLKSRESTDKKTTAKPLVDKQNKETVNKQISRSATSKTGSRAATTTVSSIVASTTAAAKPRVSSAKSTLPAKKTSLSPKVTSSSPKVSSIGKKNSSLSEAKITQNGISDGKEIASKTGSVVTSEKLEEDVPKKDAPTPTIDVPADNQLIIN